MDGETRPSSSLRIERGGRARAAIDGKIRLIFSYFFEIKQFASNAKMVRAQARFVRVVLFYVASFLPRRD
jgi:hypothetical protein